MAVAKQSVFAAQIITEQTLEDVPEEVECPYEVQYIWGWFLELDQTRMNNGFGASPITHVEISAWANGMQLNLLPFEREAIRAIDVAYISHQNAKANKQTGKVKNG